MQPDTVPTPAGVPDPAKEAVVSIPRAGAILGLSRNSAYAAALRGEIPVIKIGRRSVVPTLALVRMLEEGGPPRSAA